jgi:hypothetical protein
MLSTKLLTNGMWRLSMASIILGRLVNFWNWKLTCNKWSSKGWGSTIFLLGKCLSKCEEIKQSLHILFWKIWKCCQKSRVFGLGFVGFKAQSLACHQTTSRLLKSILPYLSCTTKFA